MYPGDWVGKSWWCDICWGLYQINIFCCIWIWTFVGQSISAALQYLIIMLYYFNLSFGYRPKSYCDFDHKSNNQSRSLRKTDLRCILKDIMSALSCSKRRLIRDWVHTHTHTHTQNTSGFSIVWRWNMASNIERCQSYTVWCCLAEKPERRLQIERRDWRPRCVRSSMLSCERGLWGVLWFSA